MSELRPAMVTKFDDSALKNERMKAWARILLLLCQQHDSWLVDIRAVTPEEMLAALPQGLDPALAKQFSTPAGIRGMFVGLLDMVEDGYVLRLPTTGNDHLQLQVQPKLKAVYARHLAA